MKTIVIAMLIGLSTPAQMKGEMIIPVEIKVPSVEFKTVRR